MSGAKWQLQLMVCAGLLTAPRLLLSLRGQEISTRACWLVNDCLEDVTIGHGSEEFLGPAQLTRVDGRCGQ